MTDPNITTLGTVTDADGIPVEVGKDYGMLTLRFGGQSVRLDGEERRKFMRLCAQDSPDPDVEARKRRAAKIVKPIMAATDEQLQDALVFLGAEKRQRLRAALSGDWEARQ